MHHRSTFLYLPGILVGALFATVFINRGLLPAFLLLGALFCATLFVLRAVKLDTRGLVLLLAGSLLLRLLLVMSIYYLDLHPFGGGADYEGYQVVATQIAHHFLTGNFSLQSLHYGHDFPVVVALVYTIFGSYPEVGKFLVVWFFVISVLFAYLLAKELGAGERTAILAGILVNLYPSYAFFGSVLLKDTLIIPLALFALWLSMKLIRRFSTRNYVIFFTATTAITYLRFYIGYAVILSFIVSWCIASALPGKKRIMLGTALALLLGFSPMMIGQGYFGWITFTSFLNPQQITQYREISYNPSSPNNEYQNTRLNTEYASLDTEDTPPGTALNPAYIQPASGNSVVGQSNDGIPSGTGSSFVVETGLKHGWLKFLENSLISFIYAFLGPFVWQLRYLRQDIALVETIPWYALLLLFLYHLIRLVRREGAGVLGTLFKRTAPLWSFGVLAMAALSLFINNYGIIVRIRIPIFISLSIMMLLVLQPYVGNIFGHWGSRIYRLKPRWFTLA